MITKNLVVFILLYLTCHLSNAQINILDSCGLEAKPKLNQYEIIIIDSLFFSQNKTKKSVTVEPKKGFDLKDKKIAFYSCPKNSDTNGNGLLSKSEFFELCRPDFKGHAGRGIVVFNEKEKSESKGFDAVIIIDCPYDRVTANDLIMKLIKK
jgi:hypothetical protein